MFPSIIFQKFFWHRRFCLNTDHKRHYFAAKIGRLTIKAIYLLRNLHLCSIAIRLKLSARSPLGINFIKRLVFWVGLCRSAFVVVIFILWKSRMLCRLRSVGSGIELPSFDGSFYGFTSRLSVARCSSFKQMRIFVCVFFSAPLSSIWSQPG